MKDLHFTQAQVTKILSEVACQKEGFNKVLQLSFEALMRVERSL
jgi:hypothetical protein